MKPFIETGWIPEKGLATVTLHNPYGVFIGHAYCHNDDMDMCNDKTGLQIAMHRATIKCYRNRRDDIKSRLAGLNQLYYSMKHSKNFNPESYENKMLQRQIRNLKDDLATIKEMIATEEQTMREYVSEKDKFYKKIRKNRNKNTELDKNN